MAAVTKEEALKEIASLYDRDHDGKLSYMEINLFLLAVLGPEWGIQSRPQKNNAFLTVVGVDVHELTDRSMKRKEGSALIEPLVKWTLATANASDQDKASLARGLVAHGYLPGPGGLLPRVANPGIAEGTFDAVLRERLKGAKDKNAMIGATMEITNAMIGFKIVPAKDIQEMMGDVGRWTNMEKVWAEDKAAEQLRVIDPTTNKYTAAAALLMKELFAQVDADKDGSLNTSELRGLFYTLTGRTYPNSFEATLKTGTGISFDQLETFFAKEANPLRDLKVFLLGLGVDEHLKSPAKGWPQLTVDAWLLSKLAGPEADRNTALHTIKMALQQYPPVPPSAAVRQVLSTIPTAAPLLRACAYVDAVASNTEAPAITSAADAIQVMITAFTYLAWGIVPQGVNRNEEPESKAVALADKQLEAFVKGHSGALEAELEKLVALAPATGPLPDPIPTILKSAGVHPPQPPVFPDPLWRTFRAVGHTWLAKFALDAHAKGGREVPHKILIGACELGGADTIAHVASRVSPSLGDWIKASATNTPLPDVLPFDERLVDSSEPEIMLMLSTYLGLGLPQTAENFARHSITRNVADSIAATILKDCKTIVKDLKVPGGRYALAAKLNALVHLAMWEERREHMKPEAVEKIVAIVKKELHFDPNDAEALKAFPLHVFFAATMGHHPDVFHPQVGMQSYYLKGDRVGGSADCMLVNLKMLKPEEQAQFTHAAMGKKLAERLNAPKPADWEANPAVLYFSDMLPYLIRVGCCFESVGVRYRVDPTKLYSLLKDVCFTANP